MSVCARKSSSESFKKGKEANELSDLLSFLSIRAIKSFAFSTSEDSGLFRDLCSYSISHHSFNCSYALSLG